MHRPSIEHLGARLVSGERNPVTRDREKQAT
jgi:hypothetical protein